MTDLRATVEAYNDAWNRHDLVAIASLHSDDIVFHNHTSDERVEGADAVRAHIARIFENWPGLHFTSRSVRAGADFVVSEWTAHASKDGQTLEWDGVDIFPFVQGRIARKDIYSSSHAPRRV